MTRWPVEPLTFSKKNPSRAIPRSTYIHPPSLAKIGQRTSEEIGNKQTNAARFIVWFLFGSNIFLFWKDMMNLEFWRYMDTNFWFKYNLAQKYYAPQVRSDRGSNSWPPDHDSKFHVTETPALTTWHAYAFKFTYQIQCITSRNFLLNWQMPKSSWSFWNRQLDLHHGLYIMRHMHWPPD